MGPRITQIGPAGSHGSREDTTIGGDSQSLHNKMQEITFLKYKNWLQYFSSKKRNSRKRMNKFFYGTATIIYLQYQGSRI